MSDRLPKNSGVPQSRPLTARRNLVEVLSREILSNPATSAFPIESEHQLCRRFEVSRVTVRLALGEMEHRGLIFRKHGKGTFAHGRSTRIHRHIGVLLKSHQPPENGTLLEILRGVQTFVRPLRSAVILISESPEEWQPPLAAILSGVIVVADNVTQNDLNSLEDRKLPFIVVGETNLPGPRIRLNMAETDFFKVGQRAADALNRAALTGQDVDDLIISFLCDLQLVPLNRVDPTFG
jgi:hypothetical protein